MSDKDTYWHEQIHRIMPELDIIEYELHQEGLVNDVLIVNNEWVFRFTKTEWGKEIMVNEDRLLGFLRPRLSLTIPTPVMRAEGAFVYQHLIGEPFMREIWLNAREDKKQSFADQLGQFLNELHQVNSDEFDWDVPHSYAPVTRETWLEVHDRVVEKVYPLLLPHQIDWVEGVFYPALMDGAFFDFDPVLVHGDLMPDHILYHPEQQQLTAVIDFGVAGLGDPATDLGSLLNYYGESLICKIAQTYPSLDALMDRALFYARTLELQWIVLGLESGENYWFTAHLGNARDF